MFRACRKARVRDNPAAVQTITQAVLWAIAILSTAWVLGDSEHASTVAMLLTGLASASVVSSNTSSGC